MHPQIWAFIYLAELFVISFAMGSLTVVAVRMFHVPRWTRFIVGFASAPFLLGTWVLAAAAILPGATRPVFILPPLMIAMPIIFWRGRQTIKWLRRDLLRSMRAVRMYRPMRLVILFFLVLVVLVTFKLVRNSLPPVHGHDALVYLSEAYLFSQERTLDAANSFTGRPDGTLRGTWHNFVWPAYLAHALMHTDANTLGYPDDMAARAAFQWTVACFLLSASAFAACTRNPGVSLLSLILLLQVPLLAYISNQCSRDGFRIVPILLLAAVLTGLSPKQVKYGFRWTYLIAPLLLAACCISGHVLGGLIAVLLALAWGLWAIILRTRMTRVALVLGALAIGLFLGGTFHLKAYLETGNFRGLQGECGIAKRPLDTAERQVHQEEAAARGWYAELLRRDQYRVSIAGLLCAVITVVIGIQSRRCSRDEHFLFFGLATFAVAVPFFGLLDFGSDPISEWFTSNFRYQMHWYPFGAVCIASVTFLGYEKLLLRQRGLHHTVAAAFFAGLIVLVSATACTTVYKRWHTSADKRAVFLQMVRHLSVAMNQMPPSKKLLLDDSRYNYYLGSKAMLMLSRPTCEILEAKDKLQLKEALRKQNIGVVALPGKSLGGQLDHSLFLHALSDPEVAVLTYRKDFLIYRINENGPTSYVSMH